MLTSMGSRLFRFLLLLVIRLRLSIGRIALALRAQFSSLWRSILTFARNGGQSQMQAMSHCGQQPYHTANFKA